MMLFLISVIMLFVGCGKKADVAKEGRYSGELYPENGLPKDKKVTLSFIFPVQGNGKDYFEYAVDTFQKRFPNIKINVRWIEAGGVAYSTLMQSLIQANDSKAIPDWIFGLTGDTISNLIQLGKLEAQDELWERTFYDNPNLKVKDGILASENVMFKYGKMYVLPHNANISGIYFDKNTFERIGVPQQPKTWSEFLEACEKIKGQGIYPMVMAGKYASSYFSAGWGAIPYEIGGEEYLQAEFNYEEDLYLRPEYISMLEKMEEFAKKGYLHPGTASFDHTQSQMELIQGKAAMVTVGAWVANEMKEVVPEDFRWGFMAFPGNDLESQKQVIVTGSIQNGWIWKDKPELNKKWTKEFNLWLLNLDVQKKLAKSGGVPFRKDYAENQTNLEGISESVAIAMEMIKRDDIWIVTPSTNPKRVKEIKNPAELAKLSKVKGDGYISIILGEKSAQDVAQEINQQYMKGLVGR